MWRVYACLRRHQTCTDIANSHGSRYHHAEQDKYAAFSRVSKGSKGSFNYPSKCPATRSRHGFRFIQSWSPSFSWEIQKQGLESYKTRSSRTRGSSTHSSPAVFHLPATHLSLTVRTFHHHKLAALCTDLSLHQQPLSLTSTPVASYEQPLSLSCV